VKDNKTIIEVNGVKLEVDLTTAKKIENYKVGDNVKVLIKAYDGKFDTYPGVIAGFDKFPSRPSINIVYLKEVYGGCEMRFLTFNKDTKDIEICPAQDYTIPFEKDTILEMLDREITSKQDELINLKTKREFFLKNFGRYFEK